jgi:hypothetical protein
MRFVRFISLCLILGAISAVARAQSVRWEPSDGGLPNTVVLVFENCEPDGQPDLPAIPGVTFTSLGTQSSFVMNGLTTTRTVSLT